MNQNEQTLSVNTSVSEPESPLTQQEDRKKAKKAFSRFALSIILPLLGANIVITILGAVLTNLTMEGVIDQSFAQSSTINVLIGAIPLLVLGYPLIYILTKKLPSRTPEKKPFKASHEIMFFLMTLSVMCIGNFISSFLASILTGGQSQNGLVNTISSMEIVTIIYTVIIAPIVEELFFRKLLLDKLSGYGEKWAIIFGALCFAMFHTNLYQFVYTFGMGLIFGYVYIKSGNIIHTIIMHSGINFIGGVLAPLAMSALNQEAITELNQLSSQGKEIPAALMETVLPGLIIYYAYLIIYFGMVVAGIISFIVNCKKFRTEKSELLPTAKEGVPTIIANAGMIVFIVISTLLAAIQLIAPILSAG